MKDRGRGLYEALVDGCLRPHRVREWKRKKKAPVFDYLVPCMQCLGHLLVDKRRLYMVWRNLQAQYSPLVSLLSPSLSAE